MLEFPDRRLGGLDRAIIAFDRTLRTAVRTRRGGMPAAPAHCAARGDPGGRERRHPAGRMRADRAEAQGIPDDHEPRHPASGGAGDTLNERERRHSAGLMRVNHAGEVAAQALYAGQRLTARDPGVRAAMEEAAREEADHLAWCRDRLEELGATPSRLDPLWYFGSFAIGAAAGLAGDRWSLGFVVESERQVAMHLGDHLARLPAGDYRSRALLRRMRADEQRHASRAHAAGGAPLPAAVRRAMRAISKVMTRSAYWI